MPGINNISNVNNLDSRKVQSKLSFQVGEVFAAKVVEVGSQGNEVVLKTTDGWQFTANAKIPLENLPKGIVKFKVTGYEDGKLQIAIVPEESDGAIIEEKSIQTILKQQNLSSSKGDLEMLKSMVGHDIPLTKENISAIKTIIDFKEKISANIGEEDIFIRKYLQSKGIDINSEQGKEINQLLKGFFSELKKVSVEELVTLKENGIDITEDNLKSFNKVFKEDTGIYKQITQNMSKEVLTDKDVTYSSINGVKSFDKGAEDNLPAFKEIIKDIIKGNELDKSTELPENVNKEITQKTDLIKSVVKNINNEAQSYIKTDNSAFKEIQELKIIQTILENDIPVTKENVSNVKTIIDLKEEILSQPKNETELIKLYLSSKNISEDSAKGKLLSASIKEFLDVVKKEPVNEVLAKLQPNSQVKTDGSDVKTFDMQFKEDFPAFKEIIKDILKGNDLMKSIEIPKGNGLAENIKNEIAQKTDFMKDVIRSMKDGDWSMIKSSINDIKVFNTVSNQYYYLDVPVNVNQRQYECKLLVKDDRKKGKKIDSENVKMFVSVKTINMGKVDAYIKVSDRNINIDLKCRSNFIKVFENENNKLLNILHDMNYNVNLKIEEQMDEANIVTTREFFQDNAIGSINVMV